MIESPIHEPEPLRVLVARRCSAAWRATRSGVRSVCGIVGFMLHGRDDEQACWGDNPNDIDEGTRAAASSIAGGASPVGLGF